MRRLSETKKVWIAYLAITLVSVAVVPLIYAPGPVWMDGGCINNGDGTAATCASSPGGAGAFNTPDAALGTASTGAIALGTGVTLIGRGVHSPHANCNGMTNWNGGPDRIAQYQGMVWLASTAANHGRPAGYTSGPWNCTAAQCQFRGARTTDSGCPGNGCGDERFAINPVSLHNDWTCVANCGTVNAAWSRAMETAIDCTGANCDQNNPGTYRGLSSASPAQQQDPSILFTNRPRACTNAPAASCNGNADCPTGGICQYQENRVELTYAGDDVNPAVLPEGSWTYNCVCNGSHAGQTCTPRLACTTCLAPYLGDGTHGQTICTGSGSTNPGADCTTDNQNASTGCPGSSGNGVCTGVCGATDTCATCSVIVNPPMSDDPATTILVPTAWTSINIETNTNNILFQDIVVGMSRRYAFKADDPGVAKNLLTKRRVLYQHIQQQADIGHSNTNGTWDNCTWQYIGRGVAHRNIGEFFVRQFSCDGCQFLNPTMRYGGAAGLHRTDGSNQANGAFGEIGSWMDPPWNVVSYTNKGGNSTALQIKQTAGNGTNSTGVIIRGGNLGWMTAGLISIDTTTDALVEGTAATPLLLHDAQSALVANNFTPDNGNGSSRREYWSNLVVRNLVAKRVGQAGATVNLLQSPAFLFCGTGNDTQKYCHNGTNIWQTCTTDDATGTGCPGTTCNGTTVTGCCTPERNAAPAPANELNSPLVQMYNVAIIDPGFTAIQVAGNHQNAPGSAGFSSDNQCYQCPNQIGDPGNMLFANITVNGVNPFPESGGVAYGMIVGNVSATGGATFRNNVFNALSRPAIVWQDNAVAHIASGGIDYTGMGSQRTCPPTSGTACTCDGTNIVFRYGTVTIPNASLQNEPSQGTCGVPSGWQSAHNTMETHMVGPGAVTNFVSGQDVHLTLGSGFYNVGQSQSGTYTTDADVATRVQWDMGAYYLPVPAAPTLLPRCYSGCSGR